MAAADRSDSSAEKPTVWLLPDQLHPNQPPLVDFDPGQARVLLVECPEHDGCSRHALGMAHRLAAGRETIDELRRTGWETDIRLWQQSFADGLTAHVRDRHPSRIVAATAADPEVAALQREAARAAGIDLQLVRNPNFIADREGFARWEASRSAISFDDFYDLMLRKVQAPSSVLAASRNRRLPEPEVPPTSIDYPAPPYQAPSQRYLVVADEVRQRYPDAPGDLGNLYLPISRQGALGWLKSFIKSRLPHFAAYWRTLLVGQSVMYHSLLAALINVGLLSPRECVAAAVASLTRGGPNRPSAVDVELFVRGLAWREYLRAALWLPELNLAGANALDAERALPEFFWKPNQARPLCLREAIGWAREGAYGNLAMRQIIGAFLLVAGCSPPEAARWFYESYADATRWVLRPNLMALSLWADGGRIGGAPLLIWGQGIAKRGDYCGHCEFDPNRLAGEGACPMNFLSWNFLANQGEKLRALPELELLYEKLDAMSSQDRTAIFKHAIEFLETL